MSISPLSFNGMIQNTHEVSQTQTHENNRGQIQQAQVTIAVNRQEEQMSKAVNSFDDVYKEEYRYDREGDGKGYERNKKGKKGKQDAKTSSSDGKVFVKQPSSSFDVKI